MYPGVEMLEITGDPSFSPRDTLAHKQQGWSGFSYGFYDLGHKGAVDQTGVASHDVQPREGSFDVFFCLGQAAG